MYGQMKNHQLCNCLGNKKLTELWHILFYIFPFYKTSGVQILIILVMIKNVEISVALESQEVFLFSPKSRSMQNEKKNMEHATATIQTHVTSLKTVLVNS
jgi:hypothetical protein